MFWGGNHPSLPPNFDGLPYPRLRGYPRNFFIKMTTKDVKKYLDAQCGFVLRFGATGNNLLGKNHPPPLGRRGLSVLQLFLLDYDDVFWFFFSDSD